MATGMPGQLEFDFTPQRGDIRVGVTPVSKSISQKTEQVLSGGVHQKSRYTREETLQIGQYSYGVTLLKNTKTHTYLYQEASEGKGFTEITLMVEDRDKKYKFIIGIPTYDIAEHSDKRLGESDNTSISIRDIRISYIRKFGTDGPRIISKGQPINNFNYFQYLFGRHDIHTQFVGVIKRILIELHGDPSLSSKNKFAK